MKKAGRQVNDGLFLRQGGDFLNSRLSVSIQENMGKFSKGQKRIAEYILNHYGDVAFMTAARLGKETNVFCQRFVSLQPFAVR